MLEAFIKRLMIFLLMIVILTMRGDSPQAPQIRWHKVRMASNLNTIFPNNHPSMINVHKAQAHPRTSKATTEATATLTTCHSTARKTTNKLKSLRIISSPKKLLKSLSQTQLIIKIKLSNKQKSKEKRKAAKNQAFCQ
jgi:hypothetical protein